ncbi:unnamed protein product [Rotaria sp. Silwood2]|nr:unnamed protein product [Rotaria sp. Silwood2]
MNFFIQHTSESLLINENAVPDVHVDIDTIFNKLVPEDNSYEHLDEGQDYMQAHAKCSLLASSINIPITSGRSVFGTWQGTYLSEHRNYTRCRNIVMTKAENKLRTL